MQMARHLMQRTDREESACVSTCAFLHATVTAEPVRRALGREIDTAPGSHALQLVWWKIDIFVRYFGNFCERRRGRQKAGLGSRLLPLEIVLLVLPLSSRTRWRLLYGLVGHFCETTGISRQLRIEPSTGNSSCLTRVLSDNFRCFFSGDSTPRS